jgi:hypothetical protein
LYLRMDIASLTIPQVRVLLNREGLPSDIETASQVRQAARTGKLAWNKDQVTVNGKRLNPLESKYDRLHDQASSRG